MSSAIALLVYVERCFSTFPQERLSTYIATFCTYEELDVHDDYERGLPNTCFSVSA